MLERVGSVAGVTRTSDGGPARALRPRRVAPVGLAELFPDASPDATVPVSGVTLDTRLVQPGDLFVALPGRHQHGAAFAGAAARAGAVAILTDRAGAGSAAAAGPPVVVVSDPRTAMATAAARVYGEPARAMTMYAVTGTNGKTTTCYLLEAALRSAGVRTGLVGTIGFRLDGVDLPGARTTVTTPESPELQGLLGYLREGGASAVSMEVSSHALVLGRADAVLFDVAAFTNLGRDHLDFHGDLESYFEAKASLFTPERTRRAVLNVDDPRGETLRRRLATEDSVPVTRVGLGPSADVHPLQIGPVRRGRTRLRASVLGEPVEAWLAAPGDYNVCNALTALAMVAVTGGDVVAAAAGLDRAVVPGRMERVELGATAPLAYVDFAHTPQAVTAALSAVRNSAEPGGRLLAVLGCGGDRDPAKREPMGAAAAGVADVVVVTDDNPRGEDPAAIRSAVLRGARLEARSGGRRVEVFDGGDRRRAIAAALAGSGPGDVVVVLGKGHERGQEVAGALLPFVDVDVLGQEWRRIRSKADSS